MTLRHLLDVDDLRPDELAAVLSRADEPAQPDLLAGRSVGLYFEKPSLRTRHSCEVAVVQLGGHPLTFRRDEVGTGDREPIADVARVLSGYHALLGGRVYNHELLEGLAAAAAVPVVNLLSDRAHPCQALTDLLTMRRDLGELAGQTLAWVGDFNNVARSLALGATMLGMKVRLACPPGYGPGEEDVDRLRAAGSEPLVTTRPAEAAAGARAVHTDVWASMGQESEAELRGRAFEGFQVDDRVMAAAAPDAVFMHCLPAHRGQEVAASVVDGDRSRVFAQAHNRVHAFRGLVTWLLDQAEGDGGRGPMSVENELRTLAKPQRQHRVARLLAENAVTSQGQLVDLLAADGVAATQATVSRDLEDLGAIKVRVAGGDTVYAIPELPNEQRAPESHLRRVFSEWVVQVAHSHNLVVLRTPPGSAHVVASALDRSGWDDVLGTVAGDDTLVVVVAEHVRGDEMARRLSELAGL